MLNESRRPIPPDVRRKLLQSRIEADELSQREIRCPHCGYLIQKVFSDATGHLSIKCQKCKNVSILNLAYFRKARIRKRSYIRKNRY